MRINFLLTGNARTFIVYVTTDAVGSLYHLSIYFVSYFLYSFFSLFHSFGFISHLKRKGKQKDIKLGKFKESPVTVTKPNCSGNQVHENIKTLSISYDWVHSIGRIQGQVCVLHSTNTDHINENYI